MNKVKISDRNLEEQVTYHKGALIGDNVFKERLKRAYGLMNEASLDAILLTKPQNMMYLVGDGRLCAFTTVSKGGAKYYGVPKTDIEDVKNLAHLNTFLALKMKWKCFMH